MKTSYPEHQPLREGGGTRGCLPALVRPLRNPTCPASIRTEIQLLLWKTSIKVLWSLLRQQTFRSKLWSCSVIFWLIMLTVPCRERTYSKRFCMSDKIFTVSLTCKKTPKNQNKYMVSYFEKTHILKPMYVNTLMFKSTSCLRISSPDSQC